MRVHTTISRYNRSSDKTRAAYRAIVHMTIRREHGVEHGAVHEGVLQRLLLSLLVHIVWPINLRVRHASLWASRERSPRMRAQRRSHSLWPHTQPALTRS